MKIYKDKWLDHNGATTHKGIFVNSRHGASGIGYSRHRGSYKYKKRTVPFIFFRRKG